MNTGEVLDLFKVSAEGEPAKAKSAGAGAVSMSKMLEEYVHTSICYTASSANHVSYYFSRLDELPPEDEYAELSLSNFLGKV